MIIPPETFQATTNKLIVPIFNDSDSNCNDKQELRSGYPPFYNLKDPSIIKKKKKFIIWKMMHHYGVSKKECS